MRSGTSPFLSLMFGSAPACEAGGRPWSKESHPPHFPRSMGVVQDLRTSTVYSMVDQSSSEGILCALVWFLATALNIDTQRGFSAAPG